MRIAVVSDVHSNLHALDAVLADIGTVDATWHLGDIVGYGPDPDGVVDRLSEIGAIGVRGNHDAAAAGGKEIDWFNADARAAMEWTRRAISDRTLGWLLALPERREVDAFTLVHGSPLDPTWEYVTTTGAARENLDAVKTTHGLNGHTHVPIAFALNGERMETVAPTGEPGIELDGPRLLLNPGSVGQPRDGDPRAAWLELDLDGWRAIYHRVDYDIDGAARAIREARLPESLAERLQFGQ